MQFRVFLIVIVTVAPLLTGYGPGMFWRQSTNPAITWTHHGKTTYGPTIGIDFFPTSVATGMGSGGGLWALYRSTPSVPLTTGTITNRTGNCSAGEIVVGAWPTTNFSYFQVKCQPLISGYQLTNETSHPVAWGDPVSFPCTAGKVLTGWVCGIGCGTGSTTTYKCADVTPL